MKKIILMGISSMLLASSIYAESTERINHSKTQEDRTERQAANFEEHKKEIVTKIGERENDLSNHKQCVNSSKNKEDLELCRRDMKEKMQSHKEERQNMRKDRQDKKADRESAREERKNERSAK